MIGLENSIQIFLKLLLLVLITSFILSNSINHKVYLLIKKLTYAVHEPGSSGTIVSDYGLDDRAI
jgi:hypothetical protein